MIEDDKSQTIWFACERVGWTTFGPYRQFLRLNWITTAKVWMILPFGLLLVSIAAFAVWRKLDRQADALAWNQLVAAAGADPGTYDPEMVSELPESAQRYFNFMIEPGAPIRTVAELDMTGHIGLGTKDSPGYRPMNAHQVLSPPHGLVWRVDTGPMSGSHGALSSRSWTRFRLFGIVPVVRVSGPDHNRSAFGRVVAEAAFWSPTSLLPGEHVHWEAVGADRARCHPVRHPGTGSGHDRR